MREKLRRGVRRKMRFRICAKRVQRGWAEMEPEMGLIRSNGGGRGLTSLCLHRHCKWSPELLQGELQGGLQGELPSHPCGSGAPWILEPRSGDGADCTEQMNVVGDGSSVVWGFASWGFPMQISQDFEPVMQYSASVQCGDVG